MNERNRVHEHSQHSESHQGADFSGNTSTDIQLLNNSISWARGQSGKKTNNSTSPAQCRQAVETSDFSCNDSIAWREIGSKSQSSEHHQISVSNERSPKSYSWETLPLSQEMARVGVCVLHTLVWSIIASH